MEKEAVKAFFLACHQAKRLTSSLPDLPQGVVPRDVRIIDAIRQLSCTQDGVRVSDIGARMNATQPSIASAVTRLEKLGYVAKSHDGQDGRVVRVALSQAGHDLANRYIDCFYDWVCEQLADVDEQDLRTATRTIDAVYNVMSQVEFALDDASAESEPALPQPVAADADAADASAANSNVTRTRPLSHSRLSHSAVGDKKALAQHTQGLSAFR